VSCKIVIWWRQKIDATEREVEEVRKRER